MERICLELADGEGVLPLERAGLLLIASNYRAAILDAQAGNRFADTVLTQGLFRRLAFSAKSLIGLGERAGARTQDPVIKSYGRAHRPTRCKHSIFSLVGRNHSNNRLFISWG
ncbi:hypothetical protein ABIF93_003407 [Bradyrhizobium japonicum]